MKKLETNTKMDKRIPPILCFNIPIFILLVILVQFFLAGCQLRPSSNDKPEYGVKIIYTQNQSLQFPDFTLEYMGERHEDSPVFKPGFTFYDFKVKSSAGEQIVSWSSGTGDIGPAVFEVAGQPYLLERAHSDKLGWLEDNEVVIWKQ